MVDTSLLLHANLLYAEFPFSEIPNVVDRSYLPVLEMLEANPSYKVILNWTGFTLDVLSGAYPEYGKYPEVIDIIKRLVKRGQVEITGTSWSHAILPLSTLEDVKRDIKLFTDTSKRILGVKPKGFFPPELSIDPLLPMVLKENGYEYSFINHDIMRYTKTGFLNVANDFKPVPPSFLKEVAKVASKNPASQLLFLFKMKKNIKELSDMRPIIWDGAGGASILAIRSYQEWNSYTLSCLGRMAIMNEKRLYKMLDRVAPTRKGYFLPFSTDFEFYGYGGNVKEEPIPVSRLKNLLEYINKSSHLKFTLPSDYLKDLDSSNLEELYLRSGSWSTDGDFALWDADPDNRRLNDFVSEVRDKFNRVGHKLSKKERDAVSKALLLSQNSDGRGWTPIPEHRLFCYNEALSAFKLMEDL
jgi:hypothetical protein